MPAGVVDALEPVAVHQGQEHPAIPGGASQQVGQEAFEISAVVQAGQRIPVGHLLVETGSQVAFVQAGAQRSGLGMDVVGHPVHVPLEAQHLVLVIPFQAHGQPRPVATLPDFRTESVDGPQVPQHDEGRAKAADRGQEPEPQGQGHAQHGRRVVEDARLQQHEGRRHGGKTRHAQCQADPPDNADPGQQATPSPLTVAPESADRGNRRAGSLTRHLRS